MTKCHLSLGITQWVIPSLALRLTCELSYDTRDPLAVALALDATGEHPVRWVFSRDLLAEGLTCRSGEGDVVLWPVYARDGRPRSFCVRVGGLRTALFEIPAEPVAMWLAATYTMTPKGAELNGVDWDELVQLAE
ncbi:SsgA family sporulation/cell division regulator [Streptomyces cocklensis]|uniref:Cell division protein, regulatory protein n=1 Tax=Actinacidiphila cocklensis TaxID=887465 RepID=A0A9W4E161_9ACTN|nr:SsgA family sporulation/cell division regulator [Actinacidiphila cocklensis]MDD1058514.1 SsgA family sporulation/cell division regulator [Actinacidiphila cocklensis]WSX75279.1 SsgA family sporulation/cell division regulator [Streptomyces sp. NBC_00899]CAG6390675.1 Cell division protein, regulatory protein [Actinacidiphila cocklensis]